MAFDSSSTAEPSDDLTRFSEDFHRLQRQKHRRHGGVESRVLTNLCFYYGEHYVDSAATMLVQRPRDPNKLHLVFNLIKKHVRKRTGRILSLNLAFGATPSRDDPPAHAQAAVVDKLILAIDDKVNQPMRSWEIVFWLLIGGVAVEHHPWVPDVTTEPLPRVDPETGQFLWTDGVTGSTLLNDQVHALIRETGRAPESFSLQEDLRRVGDVGSVVFGPLNVFVDASVRDLQSLGPNQRVYTAEIKTIDWIRSTFGTEAGDDARGSDLGIVKTRLKQLGPTHSGINLTDLIPAIQGTRGPQDPDMAMVVTGYEPAGDDYPSGREIFFVPDKVTLDDRPNPYEETPLTDYHYDPVATSFWSTDFLSDLIPGNKFLNKRMSQLGEQSNASIYDLLLLGPDLKAVDIPADKPGVVPGGINEEGQLQVARLPGPSLPGWFLESIKLTIDFLNEAGGTDLFSSGKMPGQLRGPLAIPMLQEILDAEDGPLFSHLGERFARAKQARLNRVKQFYPPIRTLNFTGRGLRDEVLVFHTSKVLRAGTEFTVRVDRRSLLPELSALREARIRERLAGPLAILYVDPRTGQLDPDKIAEDLHGVDLDRASKETQGRKFALEFIAKMWRGETVEPPMPFYPHRVFMDVLEEAMQTGEYLTASSIVKNLFVVQWNLHREILQQQADQAASTAQSAQVQNALAQATQQAAAQAAAGAVDMALDQVRASTAVAEGPPSLEGRLRQLLGENASGTSGTSGTA